MNQNLTLPVRRRARPVASWRRGVAWWALLGRGLLALGALLLGSLNAQAAADVQGPHVALYYGAEPPVDELGVFDWVVLEPGHGHDPLALTARQPQTTWLAYLSVGEVRPDHPLAAQLPPAWRIGRNADWKSDVIDPAAPGWPEWFVEQVARPQWVRGYRGFFLDTLDSYELAGGDAAQKAARRAGLVRLIGLLRAAFPPAKLVLNRGFELLDEVAGQVDLVAAESLVGRWNQAESRYDEVPERSRTWLLAQLQRARDHHHLPVLAIDYAPPAERGRAREIARRIEALGVRPYVTDGALEQLGLGSLEVLPRRVLVLHDANLERPTQFANSDVHRHIDLPLQHLGLVPVHVDLERDRLPAGQLVGNYAGVVTLFEREVARPELAAFLRRAMGEGIKIASLGRFGVGGAAALLETFGVVESGSVPRLPVRVTQRDPAIGHEMAPPAGLDTFRAQTAPPGSQTLLTLRDGRGATMDAIAYTGWGGYMAWGLGLARRAGLPDELRWVVDPLAFLRRALALPDMPVPDTTTESGRRLLMVHVDGDGFANASDQPGAPLAAQVMLDQVIARHRLPTTVSVIEGEVAPDGLNPALSPRLEAVARQLFALPHVELASHTYSHPFYWERAANVASQGVAADGEVYTLKLPGYTYSPRREVEGSIRYIERRLAPPGKAVRLLLWSGDTNPDEDALAEVERAGVLAMNGGDTLITRARNSLTEVAPLGLRKGAHYQVYAPNQNENVYTNGYTAPLYGYERVIETFELTERPHRVKPVDIYFHTYAASRRASLAALQKVYAWALAQPLHPIHASAYVAQALDHERVVIARSADGFRVRGARALRELRAPAALGQPQPGTSTGLAGDSGAAGGAERYLHLSAASADLRFAPTPDPTPALVSANARVEAYSADAHGARLTLRGHVPLRVTLRHAAGCRVEADGQTLAATGPAAAGTIVAPVTTAATIPATNAGPMAQPLPTHDYALDGHGPATLTVACP